MNYESPLEFGFSKQKALKKKTAAELINDFQTPEDVCRYMVSLLPNHVKTVLEPTKGNGNLVAALGNYDVTAPDDFFLMDKSIKFDAVVMNPPFSSGSAILTNAPKNIDLRGMKAGHYFLTQCMQKSDIIIALMPWFTISDSDVRLRYLKSFGIKSITALPRKTFQYARIQTVIIELHRGFSGGGTIFNVYDKLPYIPSDAQKKQTSIF